MMKFAMKDALVPLAVYNAHNGYYGHGILITKDNEIIHNSIL